MTRSNQGLILKIVNYETDESFDLFTTSNSVEEAVDVAIRSAVNNHRWKREDVGIETSIDGQLHVFDSDGKEVEE